jgi:hypothetical protein
MFTDVLRTSACCVSYWRGDQQSGQYHAKHRWHLALRYRHFGFLLAASPGGRALDDPLQLSKNIRYFSNMRRVLHEFPGSEVCGGFP